MNFKDKLVELNACEEATQWAGNKTIEVIWKTCPRGDWLLWLAAKLSVNKRLLVTAACDCAETVLKYVPTTEKRPLKAIQAARRYVCGKATLRQCKFAADAASVAAFYAAYSTSYSASYAAAAAAAPHAASYSASYADAAAADAADAASYKAAKVKNQKLCANLVRRVITIKHIKEKLND